MIADVLPLRAIVLQCLLLTLAIAIESRVLFQNLKTPDRQQITPRQSIQYAATMNLLSTLLGWFAIFSFFGLQSTLPFSWIQPVEIALLNFIFFNQLSSQSLSFLIVLAFVTFFISFAVKQLCLWGLRWVLQSEYPQAAAGLEPDSSRDRLATTGIRDLRKNPRDDSQYNIKTVLTANAFSYTAILAVLLVLSLPLPPI
jgi:hypothetical protein